MADLKPQTLVDPAPVKMIAMKLERNYRPKTDVFEIVGHDRPAVETKDTAGNVHTLKPAEFVEGEMKPPAIAGVGTGRKIWAGTIVRLPIDEAKTVDKLGIGKRVVED